MTRVPMPRGRRQQRVRIIIWYVNIRMAVKISKWSDVGTIVVSSEISGNLLIINVDQLFPSPALQSIVLQNIKFPENFQT